MNQDQMVGALEEMMAIEAIRRLHARYCRGIDRLDRDLIVSVFHEDAVVHHPPWFEGPVGGYADMVVRQGGSTWDGVFCHMVTNELITVEGKAASSEWYLLQINRVRSEEAPADYLLCARFLERLDCRDGEWRISDRTLVRDLTRVDPVNETYMKDFPSISNGTVGKRSREDRSYGLQPPLV